MSSARCRVIAVEMFKSPAIQSLVALRQVRLSGVEWSLAYRCTEAAKVFCSHEEKASSAKVSELALGLFCAQPGVFGIQTVESLGFVAAKSFEAAEELLEYMTSELAPKPVSVVEEVEGDDDSEPASTPAEPPKDEEPESEESKAEESKVEEPVALPEDVPTEKLELPAKVVEALLRQSRPDYDLTTAAKIRAADKQESIAGLEIIGDKIRLKILAAIDKAIGPESV